MPIVRPWTASLFFLLVCAVYAAPALGGDASSPAAEPVLEPATLRSLGVYWIIKGDDNRNAQISVSYRATGSPAATGPSTVPVPARGTSGPSTSPSGDWKPAPPLWRVTKNAQKHDHGGLEVPADAWLFAGSIFLLEAKTEYQIRLRLHDPEGGDVERILSARTIGEPVAPAPLRTLHVAPATRQTASVPADGSAQHPYTDLDKLQNLLRPGDLVLIHAGVYPSMHVTRSGEPGRPIIYRSAGDGEAAIDGGAPVEKLTGHALAAIGVHDVWFERISVRGAWDLIRAHESARIVVRRCHLYRGLVGVTASGNDSGKVSGFFIADNVLEGVMPWPTTHAQWKELPESRGVWLTGTGHVVCYNRISHFKDGMDVDESVHCSAIDFHNNDVSEMFDDGTELDESERNTRCFENRYTNVFQGISFQPIFGGPAYAFRNAIYNVQVEPFKLHNSPSGAVIVHNTVVKHGPPLLLSTGEPVNNCLMRNNLILGTEGRAAEFSPPMVDCDFDYDGYGGFTGPYFLKWNGERYETPETTRASAPVYRHVVVVDPLAAFASGIAPPTDDHTIFEAKKIDLRLAPKSAAVDAGQALPGFNDGFAGAAPDLGAYELGAEVPWYGPRVE